MDKILKLAAFFDTESTRYFDESDYERGNYCQGISEGLRQAVSILEEDYNDHPPLT